MRLDAATLIPYLLVLARLSGVMITTPGFSSTLLSARIKLIFTVLMTLTLTPSFTRGQPVDFSSEGLPLMLAIEGLVGLVIGFSFYWTMAGVAVAGEMAGLQMGLGVASTVDPTSGSNALFTQIFFALVYMVMFLTLDGHHIVIRSVHASYNIIPAGTTSLNWRSPQILVEQTAQVLVVGIRLAAGILIPLFLSTFALALVSRAFPQANVFILSFAVSLLLGLYLFALSAPALRVTAQRGIERGAEQASNWLKEWGVANP